jgi:CRISPR-associated protein Cmr3
LLIKIDPLDTLFFRDGKPFTMGDDNWANGIFPPHPSVVFGALRSAYFSHHIDDLKKATGPYDPTGKLHIRGIYFYDHTEKKIYLPLPMDCVKNKNEEKNEVSLLPYVNLDKIKTSCPTQYALKGTGDVETVNGGFITSDLFKKYLTNSERSFSFIKISDKISIEHKIGIGIDKNSGTSEVGKLYRTGMNRLNDLSLLIEFDDLDLPASGFLKLGGEGRAVSYEIFSSEKFEMSFQIKDNQKFFKLYLLTPAIFKNGWLPERIDEKTLIVEYPGLKLKLITASIGKTIYVGGFDMKARKPKPMYKAVPAGSVYYFELMEGEIQTAFKLLNQKAISDYYSEQGFGIVYFGGVKNA